MSRKPYRIKKRKPIWRTKLFWRVFIFVLFFGEIFYSIYFLNPFQVKAIEIIGNEKVAANEIEGLVRIQATKKVLFFSSRSIFLVDPAAIKEEIMESFPGIAQADIKRNFLQARITTVIRERMPEAVYCQNENCFSLDKEGIAFEATKENLLEVKKPEDESLVNLGQRVFGEDIMSLILEIKDKMENELKIPLVEILVLSDDRLNARTKNGWEIYFNAGNEMAWQLTKLQAVLEKEIPEDKRRNLEYIDLRFGNLAPYKYR